MHHSEARGTVRLGDDSLRPDVFIFSPHVFITPIPIPIRMTGAMFIMDSLMVFLCVILFHDLIFNIIRLVIIISSVTTIIICYIIVVLIVLLLVFLLLLPATSRPFPPLRCDGARVE